AAPQPAAPPPVVITSVRLSQHTLHRARRADRRRRRPAQPSSRATVTVRLSRPASLTVHVAQRRPGRRQGSTCRAPTPATPTGRPCTRYVTLPRRLSLPAAGYTRTFTLTPAFGGSALPAGYYRLAVTAIDAAGRRAAPRQISIRVTP
ncbi:MAG: hypothetical protein JWM31_1615, partial [Solirubrobacterales bacterium]|nr:hypothetical protein [Solirubrobacterales bacterium]